MGSPLSRSPLASRTPGICWAVWALIFLTFTWVAWSDLPTLIARILSDDMFYYLSVARHFALEGVASFDGVTSSNGFHPLWMLILAGVIWFTPHSLDLPVHLALTAIAFCFIAQGVFLQRILAHYGHGMLGALVSIWWLLNPVVIQDVAAGMETAIYGACFLGTLLVYLPRRHSLTAGQAVGVGTLLGLTALARLDAAILVLAVCLDAAWVGLRRRAWAVPLGVILPVLVLLVPWVIWSVRAVGTPLPTSGRALDLWAFEVHEAILKGRWGQAIPGLARNFLEWTDQHLRLLTGMPDLPRASIPLLTGLLGLSLGLAAWVVATVFMDPRYAALRVFLLVAAVHNGYYLLRVPHSRYLLPSLLVEIVTVSVVIGDSVTRLQGSWTDPLRRRGAVIMAGGLLVWSGLLIWQWNRGTLGPQTSPLHVTMYTKGVPWLQEHTAPGAIIGSFNSGIFGYFSGRRVVNLDGVINEDAYRALAAHRLADYIDEAGLDWVTDWGGQLEWFLAHFSDRSRMSLQFIPVATFDQTWQREQARLVVYRVAR